ncbi:Scarecrow-like protein 11 [Capsicum baccatum]|uniref:Scarecrow-like protein 11 n=1 Tax=Capsicum baccatum TaxID=33114 RepID=A0A2G2WND4_CAPBA|nr:Scarecrow-like protein 11 [Capsicum baccatum]
MTRTLDDLFLSVLALMDRIIWYLLLVKGDRNRGFYSNPRCCKNAGGSIEERLAYKPLISHEKLKLIRLHRLPYGEATERMAHYFADALEARLAGTGIELYEAFAKRTITAADILKAFQVYVTALSNIFAGESIGMLTREATSIHIIDFGILYGFQWPCFIQGISLGPSGPPKLRITGIDFPQPGFRPAERVEETGRRLAKYCRRFNVPFEYNAIAKKWDSIQLNDLKINKGEMLVVNCLYRLIHVPDETASENSPRDDVLRLIKQIKPDVFLHGIINGTYNSSFFETRFKEALFHYSSLFDMEATVPRENQERLLFEKVNFGKEIMTIVAWEGTARFERPEPYKQWQLRNQRAGFRQIPLERNTVNEVKAKVQLQYHKDFLMDEDGNWMLQGWKGRVIYALSCWEPVDN